MAKFIQENEFYVETQIYQKVRKLLEDYKCVILVGKEGTGKTSMAVRLMFSYIQRDDFFVRKLSCPEDFSRVVDPNENHLIYIDNVFECSEHALPELKKSFDFIQEFLPSSADVNKRAACKVHIVMTSRPHTLKVAVNKLKISPYLLNKCIIDLDSNDWELGEDDKKEIMRKRMEFAFNEHTFKKEVFSPTQWSHIVQASSPFGFPLCAQLFAFDLECRKLGTDFFSNPHSFMLSRVKDIIKRDSTKKTEVLFLLILINHIQNKLLNITENEKCWKVLCDLQLTTQLGLAKTHVDNLYALASNHLEVLVRESPGPVLQFKHHSVQEAVQNYFFEKYTIKAIEILPLHVLFRKMHRDYVLKLAPILKSVFFKRLREEIKNGNLCEVCQYEELKDIIVSKEFIEHMMADEGDFINILHTTDENKFPLMYKLTLVVCEETIQYLLGHATMKRICSDQELYNQYFYSLLACCKLHENKTLTEYILMVYAEKNIQNHLFKTNETNASSKSNDVTYLSPLLVALKNENKSAMQLLLKYKATFLPVRWQAWPFLHICCKYGVSQFCCSELLASIYDYENTLNPENELKRDLDISKIKSVENEDLKDFILKLHNLFKDPGSPETILLNLVEIPYVDITGELILSFCSIPDVKESGKKMNKHPMNFANADGNTVLHLYLKLHDDNDGPLEESEDEDIDSENESDCQLHSVEVCNNDPLELIKRRTVINRSKHLSTIKILCTSGIDINMKNKSEQTPLMIEIGKSRPSIEAISILLKYGANPNEDQLSQTCLHKIINQNYKNYKTSEIIELLSLLIIRNAAVDKKDNNGDNLIFLELKRQNPRIKILRFLINVNIDMSVKDALGRNALCFALQLPNYDVPKKERVVRALLISKKLNVLSRDKYGRSALGLAILDDKCHEKILQQIVDHETCAYPLHECIKENFAENIKMRALELLISTDSKKSNIRAVNDKLETVLITAAKSCPDMDKLFHFLITKDIDINARDVYQNTALYYLIESNDIEFTKRSAAIDLLLSKHPFVHDEDGIKGSHSPLLTALKFMIDRSYIVIVPTQTCIHPIKTSLQNPDLESSTTNLESKDVSLNLEIVEKILDIAETDLKAYVADEQERTLLHYCASSRFTDDKTLPICKRLVELGVDVDKKDKDHLTCVDMAFKYSGKNHHTLVYLMSSCNLENFKIDEALQYLADDNSLNVEILKYMKENILSRKKPTRNILHYLASIGYEPKSQSKSERDELFDVLESCFAVDEENVDSKIPLHIAIEKNSSLSCVSNFLRITKSCINKPDSNGNTALHLVLESEREDIDVLTIVKQMIHFEVNVNNKNKMHRTPLMVAVKCLKERTSTIKAILEKKPDLLLKDRAGNTILHHCIEAKKDDFTACSLLSLFLNSGLPVPLKSNSGAGLTPLNLAATIVSYSRVLCLLRLVHNKECMADTVDNEGRNPLYNTAASLPGINPLIVLERLIRSYIFLRQEDNPYFKTNNGDTVFDICKESNYRSLSDLLKTKKTSEEKTYFIIQKAWIDVSRKLYEKSHDKFDDLFLRDNPLIPKKIENLIADSLPYLSKCRLDLLKNELPEEEYENESSVENLENVNDTK